MMKTSEERSLSTTRLALSWEATYSLVDIVAEWIKNLTAIQLDFVAGVPRGGLIPAVALSYALDIPMIDISQINDISKDYLVMDDCTDTGEQLEQLENSLEEYNCLFCSLIVKPWTKMRPDFAAHETRDWIIWPWEAKQVRVEE